MKKNNNIIGKLEDARVLNEKTEALLLILEDYLSRDLEDKTITYNSNEEKLTCMLWEYKRLKQEYLLLLDIVEENVKRCDTNIQDFIDLFNKAEKEG